MLQHTVVRYVKMNKFSTFFIFGYFFCIWLTGNVSGCAWSATVEYAAGDSVFVPHLSDTEMRGLSGWVDIFDKGENEENLHENDSSDKKSNGVNPFTVIFYKAGKLFLGQSSLFVKYVTNSTSLIVLFHVWKFHL